MGAMSWFLKKTCLKEFRRYAVLRIIFIETFDSLLNHHVEEGHNDKIKDGADDKKPYNVG